MMTKTMRLGRDAEVKQGNNGEFVHPSSRNVKGSKK